MKFTLESPLVAAVRSVSDTEIVIGDQKWSESVALTTNGVLEDWTPATLDTLGIDDLAELLKLEPELIVVGTGSKQLLPNRELMFAMARKGVGLEVMDTPAAARTFNVLISEGRSVAAILYVAANL
ncbi:MAG: Mth938-like domain-containing protein [Woeseiaceae bacterium]